MLASTKGSVSGNVRVSVKASDGFENVSQEFDVTVQDNNNPESLVFTVDTTVNVSSPPFSVNMNRFFTDPDSDMLTFGVKYSDTSSVGMSVIGNYLVVLPLGAGTTTAYMTATDGKGSPVLCPYVVHVGSGTGVKNNYDAEKLIIYPVPVTNSLTVSTKNTGKDISSVKIYSVTGSLVLNKITLKPGYELTLKTGALKGGTYILVVQFTDDTTAFRSIIKNK